MTKDTVKLFDSQKSFRQSKSFAEQMPSGFLVNGQLYLLVPTGICLQHFSLKGFPRVSAEVRGIFW